MPGDGRPTAVVDANVLLNLALPVVDGRPRAPDGGDPLQALLRSYDVRTPETVLGEVTGATTGNDDLLAAAGELVLGATAELTTHAVAAEHEREFGLDRGEAMAIHLANGIDADLLVTDEFGGGNAVLVTLALDDPGVFHTTPHVLCVLADRGVLDPRYVASVLAYLAAAKGWERVYLDELRRRYLH